MTFEGNPSRCSRTSEQARGAANQRTRVYFWVHHTSTHEGNTGVQRVVRGLGAALAADPEVEIIPVCWCAEREAIIGAGAHILDRLARFHGPRFPEPACAGRPLHVAEAMKLPGAWFLLPEVPHVAADASTVPAVPVVLDYARYHGLRAAAVFYDLIPLRFPSYEAMAPAHAGYALALAGFDVLLPISSDAGDDLVRWWREMGHETTRMPPVRRVSLAAELAGTPRATAPAVTPTTASGVRLLALGTVEPRKNQLEAMKAVQRLRARRPDLDIQLDVVGHVHPAVAERAAALAAASRGAIRLLGYRPDDEVRALIGACNFTVFLSLAEGYGLPVAESLWQGRPCLCSDLGSMREIAEDGGCLLVDPRDPDAIEDAIERVASDPQLRHQLADQACRRPLLDWEGYGRAVLSELRSLPPVPQLLVLEGSVGGAASLVSEMRSAGVAVRRLHWRTDTCAWLPGGADGADTPIRCGDGYLGCSWGVLPLATARDLGEVMRSEVEARGLSLNVALIVPAGRVFSAHETRALATANLALFASAAERDATLALTLRSLPRTTTLRHRFRVAADPLAVLAEIASERSKIASAGLPRSPKRIFYWTGLTATQPFNTGVQRVTRCLGAAIADSSTELIPVKWDPVADVLAPLNAEESNTLAAWGGPPPQKPRPLPSDLRGEWLLIPEIVIPLTPPGSNPARLGKRLGMRVAAIFYDATPVKLEKGIPGIASDMFGEYADLFGEADLALPISWSVTGDLRRYIAGRGLPVPSLVPCPLAGALPGAGRQLRAQPGPAPGEALRLLAVGTWEPRKNYPRLLRALARARALAPDRPIELTIVGRRIGFQAFEEEADALIAAMDGVTLHEHLSDENLVEIYRSNHATVFASWEEGFGLPVLESLWRGLPCLCHNGSSLAEVAPGGGTLSINMLDEDDIARAVARLATESSLLDRLGAEAIARPIRTWTEYGADVMSALARAGSAPGWPLPAVITGPSQDRPLLSCAITTYNRSHWLRHSLPRLLEAARPFGREVEVIVCDNASTDPTPELVGTYAGTPGLTLRRNPKNVGMLGNLGETARASSGRFVWLLGDDDLVVDGAIEAVLTGLRAHPDVEMAYMNYAYTHFGSPDQIADAGSVIRDAKPIGYGGPNRYVTELREVAAYNENLFTAIYACAFRRDHALRAYGQDTSGAPFSSLLTCVPSSVYALAALADRPAWWVGRPAVVININVSWLRWALLWHLERMPDLFDAADLAGVDPVRVDRHRIKHASQAGLWTRDALMNAESAIGEGTSVARLIERCKHLPAFQRELPDVYEAYREAWNAGRVRGDVDPPAELFQRYGVTP